MKNIDGMEMMEFCFADTAAKYALRTGDRERTQNHIRESLRLHRFQVFAWLLENGVQLPAEVVVDSAHPEVGKQKPDQPC